MSEIKINQIRKFKDSSVNRGRYCIVVKIEKRQSSLGERTYYIIKFLDKNSKIDHYNNLSDFMEYTELIQ